MTRYGVIEWKSSNTACVCVLWCYSDDRNWKSIGMAMSVCHVDCGIHVHASCCNSNGTPLVLHWCSCLPRTSSSCWIYENYPWVWERFTIANWHTMISDTLWRTLFSSSLASQPQSVPQRRSLSVSARGGRVWRLRTTLREQLERNYWRSHA